STRARSIRSDGQLGRLVVSNFRCVAPEPLRTPELRITASLRRPKYRKARSEIILHRRGQGQLDKCINFDNRQDILGQVSSFMVGGPKMVRTGRKSRRHTKPSNRSSGQRMIFFLSERTVTGSLRWRPYGSAGSGAFNNEITKGGNTR